MTRELLQQALEALEHITKDSSGKTGVEILTDIHEAVETIRDHLAKPQGEPVAAAGEDLAIYQSIADNYFKSIRPAHTEAEVQELLDSTEGRHEVTIRRILGVPA